MGMNILLFLALLPGILIIIYVYRMDKVEKEPWGLILRLVLLGALSCVPAAFMETFIDGAMPAFPEGSLAYALSMAFVSAALCEEICKFLFLRFGSWNNPNFGYRFDGILYGVSVAVGFAVLENIMYVMMSGLETALMRGVLAVPLHAFCGLFMGVFFGAAKKARIDGKSSAKFNALALIVPFMIHGIYDTLAFLENSVVTVILLAFVLLMYIVSIRCVRAYSKDDASSAFYEQGETLSGYGGEEDIPLSDMGREMRAGAGAASMHGGGAFGGGYTYSNRGMQTSSQRPHPGQVKDGKIILICPHCRRGLRVPAAAGRIRIKCPGCNGEFEEIT